MYFIGVELIGMLYLNSYEKKDVDMIMTYFQGSKKIINLVKQVAPWDFELIIFANNFEDSVRTMNELTNLKPNLFKNRTCNYD